MELLVIGKVLGTHHLKGAVKVISNMLEFDKILGNKVILEFQNGEAKVLQVEKVEKMLDKKWIVEFKEILNKSDAILLKNSILKARRDIFGIKEDEYLINDTIGMKVFTEEKEYLGVVVDICETAAHDIFVVEDEEYETLIPDVEVFIKNINFEKKEIIVNLLEGMKEKKK